MPLLMSYHKKIFTFIAFIFTITLLPTAAQNQMPTVFTEPVGAKDLYHIVNYGGRISPINTFPQNANYGGIVRQIAVSVGQRVTVGTPLYSVQQTMPGAIFQAGWVYALNNGIVAQVSVNVGEQITTADAVVTIADISSYRIDFFINDRDANRIKMGDAVYLSSLTQQINEAEKQLKNLETRKADIEEINKQKAKIQKIASQREEATGRISLLPLIPDLNNGLFSVRAQFRGNRVMPIGRFEIIELHVDQYHGLAIEQTYITKRYGKSNVTVVRDGKIEYQEVDVGDNYGSVVSILGGLNEGDEIVVGSNRRYKLGDEVIVSERSSGRN